MASVTEDRVLGTLLGTAVGDALGMPVEGLSHTNVRTYYLGIKEYRDDEQREDLRAGQWTDDTQFTFAVARAITGAPDPANWPAAVAERYVALQQKARRWGPTTTAAIERLADGTPPDAAGDAARPTNGAAMRAAPLGLWWAATDANRAEAFAAIRPVLAVTHRHPVSLCAGWGQAAAVRFVATQPTGGFDRDAFWTHLQQAVVWGEDQLQAEPHLSQRMDDLSSNLDRFPLDLGDACDGVGVRADESWPFACAMFARRPHLLENTLLSGINVGGDADTTGALMGSLLGALHGWAAFPDEWRAELEDVEDLKLYARALAQRLLPASSA
jgi:ADP-ribosylglycohydrolase